MRSRSLRAMLLAGLCALPEIVHAEPTPGDATASVQVAADPPPCTGPASDRAPDPRCDETLDGRVTAGLSADLAVQRAALAVPRFVVRGLFWPVVETTDVVEHNHLIDWMHVLLTTDDGLVGVRPVINYSTSFLPSGGARFFYRRLPGPGSEVAGLFETAGPAVMLGRLELRSPTRIGLVLSGIWDRRDDRLFAGNGPNSMADLLAAGQGLGRYGSDNFAAQLRWSRPLPGKLIAHAQGDLQWRDYTAADVHSGSSVAELYGLPADTCAAQGMAAPCVDERQLPGFERGMRIVHEGGGLGIGLRDLGREGAGASLIVDGTFAEGFAGDPSRHLTLSAETVLAVGTSNRAFLLRGRAAMVERLGDAPVPFEELISPSGAAGMRGFPEGRFRGESGLVGTAEYRWYVASYLDASVFTDLGTVAGRQFAGISWDRWFPTFGIGFRRFMTEGPYWEAKVLDGIQLAYAPDNGFRILLSMAGF